VVDKRTNHTAGAVGARRPADHLTDALDQFGKLSAVSADSVNKTKASLVQNSMMLGRCGVAGQRRTRHDPLTGLLATFPWIKSTLGNFQRGDYANLTAIFDLT